jgi:hypothetical protein
MSATGLLTRSPALQDTTPGLQWLQGNIPHKPCPLSQRYDERGELMSKSRALEAYEACKLSVLPEHVMNV